MKKIIAVLVVFTLLFANSQLFTGSTQGVLSVASISPVSILPVGSYYPNFQTLSIGFSVPATVVGDMFSVQDTDLYVQNFILINGRTIAEINADNVINRTDGLGTVGPAIQAHYIAGMLYLYIFETATDALNLDGTDSFVFKSGFTSPAGDIIGSDITYSYNGAVWVTYDLSINQITTHVFPGYQSALSVIFNNPTNLGGNLINMQDVDSNIRNLVLINGVSINDICNSGAAGTQVWFNYVGGVQLDIWILDSCTLKLKRDGTDVITFKSGFSTPTSHAFSSDTSLIFNSSKYWGLENLSIGAISPVSVEPVGAPGYPDWQKFNISFSSPANAGVIAGVHDNDVNVKDKIFINGKSIGQINIDNQISTPPAIQANYEGGLLCFYMFVTATDKLKLDGTDVITFKRGYTIPSGHILLNDASFNYNGTSWVPLYSFGTYKVSADNYISNVSSTSTVGSFKGGLTLGSASVVVKDKNGNLLGDTIEVTTGTIVEVTNGNVTDTYTIVIFGDVDAVAGIGMGDLAAIRDDILEATPLDGAYYSAADIYGEGNVSLNSLVGVMAFVSESGTINQDLFAVKKN